MAASFNEESGHSSLPWASVLGAGGAGGVTFVDVWLVGAVVFAAVVFGGVEVEAVLGGVVEATIFGPVVRAFAVAPVLVTAVPVAVVFGVAVGPAAFEAVVAAAVVDLTDDPAPVDAAAPVDAETGALEDIAVELPASTPVSVGVGELLTNAARPALPLPTEAFERPATKKTTPISTATAATIRETRRSQ